MKKKHPYTKMSDKICVKCGKALKLRVVENKPKATLCYKCYQKFGRKR